MLLNHFQNFSKQKYFFCKGLRRVESPCCVDMAFHAGTEWRRDSDKVDILADIIERNIKLRVIVNESKTVEKVCAHMRQPWKKYVSFDSIAMEWVELSKQFPENIEVHIADIPLLHRLYITRGENEGIANVKFIHMGITDLERIIVKLSKQQTQNTKYIPMSLIIYGVMPAMFVMKTCNFNII